ncbi:GTP-binding protein Obg/CgtA [Aggregatibacter aphrophilus NJ8700]|nr:GTP-binding protein Obg/CgtA [Aggregatibacter aphrophilus NJ8700]
MESGERSYYEKRGAWIGLNAKKSAVKILCEFRPHFFVSREG